MALTDAERTRRYRERWPEKVKAQRRRYVKTEGRRVANRKGAERERRLNPEKVTARAMVREQVRRGNLIKPDTCERCGVVGESIEASHTDYSKPLDIEWLCRPCHRRKDQP